jgi:AcrR family transcriptional regulator
MPAGDIEEREDKPVRADARRNRIRVLEAAQRAFTEEGKLVTLQEIARRAGVGAGTVYRHFPSKEDLFAAVLQQRVESLIAEAHTLTGADDPAAAFFAFLNHMVEEGRTKRDLIEAMASEGIDTTSPTAPTNAELRAAITELLTRAQEAGAVRTDIGTPEIMALLAGTILAAQRPGEEELPARVFAVFIDGLRAGPH